MKKPRHRNQDIGGLKNSDAWTWTAVYIKDQRNFRRGMVFKIIATGPCRSEDRRNKRK